MHTDSNTQDGLIERVRTSMRARRMARRDHNELHRAMARATTPSHRSELQGLLSRG